MIENPALMIENSIRQAPNSKGQQTQLRIVETAARLIHQQGYHNTGLQQILSEAEVTKGSFYFHFKDKKSLALAVIDYFKGFFANNLAVELDDPSLSAKEKLLSFHHRVCQAFSSPVGMAGCPLGNLTLELAGIDKDLQSKLDVGFEQLVLMFERVIQSGQASGEFSAKQPAKQLAEFLVSSWEGAVLRMKAAQSLQPLENWFGSINALLAA